MMSIVWPGKSSLIWQVLRIHLEKKRELDLPLQESDRNFHKNLLSHTLSLINMRAQDSREASKSRPESIKKLPNDGV